MATQYKFPASDLSKTGTWSYSTGSVAWSLLDETTPDGGTTYAELQASGGSLRVSPGFPSESIPEGSTIEYVTVQLYACLMAGSCTVTGRIYVSGSDRTHGTAETFGASYEEKFWAWYTNPATGLAWTKSEVDAISGFGFVVGSGGPMRFTRLRLGVSFTAPPVPPVSTKKVSVTWIM